MTFQRDPGKFYRMPVFFGPNPCPRWWPEGVEEDFSKVPVRSALGVRYLTDKAMLESLLPDGFSVWGEPVLTIEATYMTGFSWLAGGGYNMCDVKFPAIFQSKEGPVHGSMLMVRWEDLADPILTGREELGHNKMYCEIPPVSDFQGRRHTSMSWRGFSFLKLIVEDAVDAPLPQSAPEFKGTLSYKYMPATPRPGKQWNEEAPDAAYCTLSPPAWDGKTTRYLVGKGAAEWERPSFEQLPTQYAMVNGFASLPILEPRGGYYSEGVGGSSGVATYRLD
jgi:Acetoacetate decarboxylase (ADC)